MEVYYLLMNNDFKIQKIVWNMKYVIFMPDIEKFTKD